MHTVSYPAHSKELAISYLRFSDAVQSLGDSTRRQREANAAYAAANNLEIMESFEDLGISAYKGRNAKVGAFKALNDMASHQVFQNHGIRHILVEGFDRLSRMSVDEAYDQFRDLLRAGMTIHIVRSAIRYTPDSLKDPQMLMGAIMFMGLAHAESAQKSFRLGHRREQDRVKAREGLKEMTTVGPYWLKWNENFEWEGKKPWFKPIFEREKIVKDIFEMAAAGSTIYYICKKLTEDGVPTFRTGKGAAKNGWSTSYISAILKNEAVLGKMQPCKLVGGKPVPDGSPILRYYPPVVDVDLFNRAQAAKRPINHSSGRTGQTYTNLFKGLLKCGCCSDANERVSMQVRGTGMDRQRTKTYHYLICSAKRKRGGDGGHPTARNFSYEQFEKLFLDHVRDFDVTGLLKKQVIESPEQIIRKKIADAEYRVQNMETEIENLGKQLDKATNERIGAFIQARLETKLEELDRTQAELRQLQEESRNTNLKEDRRVQSIDTIESLKAELADAEGDDLYSLRERISLAIRSMVDEVLFYPDTGVIDLIVFGGIRAYRFRDGRLEDRVDLVPQVEAGWIPVEAYTGDRKDWRDSDNQSVDVEDPDLRRKFAKVRAIR